MNKEYELNITDPIDKKIISDADAFKSSLLKVIEIVKNNILNNNFSGIILGEDLDNTLSKYGRLNNVEWYTLDNKTYIILNYAFMEMDESVRQGFDKYNLINFDYLKDELANIGINISKRKKYNLTSYDDSKMLVAFTDKLILMMPPIKKEAPRLSTMYVPYTRKLLKNYYRY